MDAERPEGLRRDQGEREPPSGKAKSPWWLGLLPFIGIILFAVASVPILVGGGGDESRRMLLLNGVVYMIGWAGIGAGISHLFFGKQISASIGFEKSPYEIEVGFCDLSFGIVGVLAPHFSPDYWFAIILFSSLYRIGCGVGHIAEIVRKRNYAINNTAILLVNFGMPVFLLVLYYVAI